MVFGIPAGDEGRMDSYFRYKREPEVRRQHRRQAPPPPQITPPPAIDDGISSDDDNSPSTSPPDTPSSTAFPVTTSISSAALTSALSSLRVSSTTSAPTSTTTTRSSIASSTSRSTSQSTSQSTTLVTRQSPTLTLPRNQLSQIPPTSVPTGGRTANPDQTPPTEKGQPQQSGRNWKLNNAFNSAKSQWGGWSSRWGGGGSSSTKPDPDGAEAERQQRMGRVRTSLLGEKELRGGLMGIGNGSGVATKAVLKPDSNGKMIMTRSDASTGGGVSGLDFRNEDIYGNDDRVHIEASGRWEDPVTVARVSVSGKNIGPFASGGLVPIKPSQLTQIPKPAVQASGPSGAGGLGATYMQDRATREIYNPRESLTTISKELSQEHEAPYVGGRGNRATQYSESQYNGSGGSEKSFAGRARERESKVSLAKWRDPVSWVKDQVDRRNGTGGEKLPS